MNNKNNPEANHLLFTLDQAIELLSQSSPQTKALANDLLSDEDVDPELALKLLSLHAFGIPTNRSFMESLDTKDI